MKKILFYFIIFFPSCSLEERINKDIQILLKYADAYEINLINETYTVFYENKPPTKIKFKLSKNEKEKITEQYYNLKLNLIPQEIDFTNNCQPSQSGVVFLFIKNKTKFQNIKIGRNCKDGEVSRVERFIELIDKTIRAKPEIRNAPKTNIFYVD